MTEMLGRSSGGHYEQKENGYYKNDFIYIYDANGHSSSVLYLQTEDWSRRRGY